MLPSASIIPPIYPVWYARLPQKLYLVRSRSFCAAIAILVDTIGYFEYGLYDFAESVFVPVDNWIP